MSERRTSRVVVAHRRAPVLRMLHANLRADGLSVSAASTAEDCLAAIRAGDIAALVLDADLLREGVPDGSALLEHLRRSGVPLLLVSFDPADRVLARSLKGARFLSRTDNIDEVLRLVHRLLAGRIREPVTTHS